MRYVRCRTSCASGSALYGGHSALYRAGRTLYGGHSTLYRAGRTLYGGHSTRSNGFMGCGNCENISFYGKSVAGAGECRFHAGGIQAQFPAVGVV